jgi:hypothetical protein
MTNWCEACHGAGTIGRWWWSKRPCERCKGTGRELPGPPPNPPPPLPPKPEPTAYAWTGATGNSRFDDPRNWEPHGTPRAGDTFTIKPMDEPFTIPRM